MKLIINTTDLNAGVLAATRALSAKSALPILEGIYICARENDMTLVCTDMSLRIEATIPAEVREEGAAVVPGRIFSEMVRKLPGETVEIDGDESSIKIKSGRSRSTLQTNRASDYPPMPEIGQRESITIKRACSEVWSARPPLLQRPTIQILYSPACLCQSTAIACSLSLLTGSALPYAANRSDIHAADWTR